MNKIKKDRNSIEFPVLAYLILFEYHFMLKKSFCIPFLRVEHIKHDVSSIKQTSCQYNCLWIRISHVFWNLGMYVACSYFLSTNVSIYSNYSRERHITDLRCKNVIIIRCYLLSNQFILYDLR